MREIQLQGGDVALVDDDDYPLLSRFKWQRAGAAGYAATTIETVMGANNTIYMHRMILGGFSMVDHINLNPLDCRKSNLRRATWQENQWNKGKPKGCKHGKTTSKYKGVSRVESKTKGVRWFASIKHVAPGAHKSTGKLIRIGYFNSEDEAARAYNRKVVELRGEWAWLNPVPELPPEGQMNQ